jgi:uncharacterized membrane protein (UPF0136 family)
MPSPNVILWIYIALLVVGGLIGFFKAKSQVSLYLSFAFAAALAVCALPDLIKDATLRANAINALMAVLLVVFIIRLGKTKKFMPAGLMLIATIAALVLRNVDF